MVPAFGQLLPRSREIGDMCGSGPNQYFFWPFTHPWPGLELKVMPIQWREMYERPLNLYQWRNVEALACCESILGLDGADSNSSLRAPPQAKSWRPPFIWRLLPLYQYEEALLPSINTRSNHRSSSAVIGSLEHLRWVAILTWPCSKSFTSFSPSSSSLDSINWL